MDLPIERGQTHQLTCPLLPLAVYREVAAHLRQVTGVKTNLIMRSLEHDPTEKFNYYQSQVAALKIGYELEISAVDRDRITEILNYYAQRYSPWHSREVESGKNTAASNN